jgi:hydrophobic/amphiphilic exporter-1 (mainly G- bacteria), HAE1 family
VISFTAAAGRPAARHRVPEARHLHGNAGHGPAEIERFITEPIEAAVSRVPGVESVESVSREGVSMVVLRFAWGTDMDFAALNVRENLDGLRGTLPERAQRPVVLRTDPRSEPIMAISVAADIDLWDLKELTESVFRRRLEQIDGVAQARSRAASSGRSTSTSMPAGWRATASPSTQIATALAAPTPARRAARSAAAGSATRCARSASCRASSRSATS